MTHFRHFAVRLALVLVALQVSGLPAVVEDQCGPWVSDSDCPLEKAGKSCSAGCPSCHIVAQVVLRAPAAIAGEPVVATNLVRSIYDTSAPRAPALPGLYRPPRGSRPQLS